MREYKWRKLKAGWAPGAKLEAGWAPGAFFFLEVGRCGFQVVAECPFGEWRRWDLYFDRTRFDRVLYVGPWSFDLYRHPPQHVDFAV